MVTIYNHPEGYPPTLNAIKLLCKQYNKVILHYRDELYFIPKLPSNCDIYKTKSLALQNASFFEKLRVLIHFIFNTIRIYFKSRPKWILCYDQYSFFTCCILKKLSKIKVWYHNHDVLDFSSLKKYSLSWLIGKYEQRNLDILDLFSLPDKSRLIYFNEKLINCPFIEIPNYPILDFNNGASKKLNKKIKVLYQGRITEGHGILELAEYVNKKKTLDIELHLIGSYDNFFKNKIERFVEDNNLKDKIIFHNRFAYYEQLKSFTCKFDIGLGVMEPLNIQLKTCAKASNKIYEYIAFGMPVILYDNEVYKSVLSKYRWALFTSLDFQSYDIAISTIIANYREFSDEAYQSFKAELNYEKVFLPAINILS